MRPQVSRRWLLYLAAAGPGLIAAAAGNDAGGIVTYSSAGAQFIYRTLFLMVLITIAYVIVLEMVALLAVHTGMGLAALIRAEFDLRLTAFAITAFAIANVGLMVTEFGGIATSFELFNVSRYISVPIAAVAIWSLVLFGSYRSQTRLPAPHGRLHRLPDRRRAGALQTGTRSRRTRCGPTSWRASRSSCSPSR